MPEGNEETPKTETPKEEVAEKKAEGEESLGKQESDEMKILKEIHAVLKQLVESDKKVHSDLPPEQKGEIGKNENPAEESVSREEMKKAMMAIDDLKKTQSVITDLKTKIETMEKETIRKGGEIVIISDQLKNGDFELDGSVNEILSRRGIGGNRK